MKFYQYIEDIKDKEIDIYFDMDGVLAEYDIGNFDYNTIRPLKSIIKIVEDLISDGINVKILSICKTDEIIGEKKEWLKKYMPFFDLKNAIFISKENENYSNYSSKELKSNYLKDNINKNRINIVVDDDNEIIKYIKKNNTEIKIFQISSLIR